MRLAKNKPSLPPLVEAGKRGRALVVEADLIALTERRDPNVIFWKPGWFQEFGLKIPQGVTHLWVARFVSEPRRSQLISVAQSRGVEIWDCVIGELVRKLGFFWEDGSNRAPLSAASNGNSPRDTSEDGLFLSSDGRRRSAIERVRVEWSSEEEDLKDHGFAHDSEDDQIDGGAKNQSSQQDRIRSAVHKRFLTRRLKLLKAAHARVKARANGEVPASRVEVITSQKSIKRREISVDQLRGLAEFDRLVFLFYLGDNGGPPRPLTAVAKEFGLPEPNARRLVERVQNAVSGQ